MNKPAAIISIILLISSLSTAQTAKAGVDQSIKVSVERADHGLVDRTQAHCLQNNLDFCKNNASIMDAVIVMLNLEGWFESEDNEEEPTDSSSNPQVIG